MKIYILKRKGKNWLGNIHFNGSFKKGEKEICYTGIFFFRKKDAEIYRKEYDGKYGNPFIVWPAKLKEDKRDNRKRTI